MWSGVRVEAFVMVKNCCAVGCTKVYQKSNGISFYRFPTNVERKRRWIAAVRRENWMPSKYSWICSQHFMTGKKSNNPLAPNYVPSVFEHVDSPVKRRLENKACQFERRQAMKKRRRTAAHKATTRRKTTTRCDDSVVDVVETGSSCTVETCNDENTLTRMASESPEESSVQTDPSEAILLTITERLLQVEAELSSTKQELAKTSNELSQVKSELLATNDQIAVVKAELTEEKKVNARLMSENSSLSKRVVSEQSLSEDDKMVKYYTGLPSFDLLNAISELVIADVPTNLFSGCSCSPLQQLLIVLMKLRLNLGDQDLPCLQVWYPSVNSIKVF